MVDSHIASAPTLVIPAHIPADRVVDFDIYNPRGVSADFHRAWKSLHNPGIPDIVWTPHNGGHWIVTRGKLIHELFGDPQRFSSRCILVPKEVGLQHQLLPTTMDPPEHKPYRTLLDMGLAPRAVQRVKTDIRTLAARLIGQLHSAGECNFTTDYAEMLPIHIFLLMVDLPLADAPRMKHWADQFTRPDGSMTLVEATGAFGDYLEPFVVARMQQPGDDMLSRLVSGKVNDRPLTYDEAIKLSIQILVAGLDTVVNFLNFVMLFLAENPDQRQQLVNDPALIPSAVDEMVRRYGLVIIGRLVKEDMVYEGLQFKVGEMIIIPSPLHGLDERENDKPWEVNFARQNSGHSTFGHGPHRCPGAHLARTEVIITLEEWLARIPEFSLAPGLQIRFRGGVVACIEALPLVWNAV